MTDWKTAVKAAVRRQSKKRSGGTFSRQDIIEDELRTIVSEVRSVGLTPEQTLSRELQELSDEGFIIFVDGRGLYQLIPEKEDSDTSRKIVAKYAIDGFRSLRPFSISLENGLNVLVGPNGSGKTNFLDFLDFLSILITRDASTAVSQAGGVSRVFSHESNKKSSPKLTARLQGNADIEGVWDDPDARFSFQFEYFCEVRFSKSHSSIYISAEKIKFFALRSVDEPELEGKLIGSVQIRRRSPSSDVEPIFSVSPKLRTTGLRNPLRYSRRSNVRPKEPRLQSRDSEVFGANSVAPDESILALRSLRPALDAVRAAVSRGRTFNLIPSDAREPDELSRSPIISQDGSGLSATLYHMQQLGKQRSTQYEHRFKKYGAETLQTITEWTRLVLPELYEISAVSDPHSGKYVVWLTVGKGERSLKFPLQSASDGTIKWLAFASMILTRGGAYSLEEPENFLHPRMQQFLVELIRGSIEDEGDLSYFILSTHSESIINQLRPKELILFRFRGGKTLCKRLDNADSVEKEINDTGFGLGYYYASNAVS